MFRYVDALCLLPLYMYTKTHREMERENTRILRFGPITWHSTAQYATSCTRTTASRSSNLEFEVGTSWPMRML